jgi:hypothetical protein
MFEDIQACVLDIYAHDLMALLMPCAMQLLEFIAVGRSVFGEGVLMQFWHPSFYMQCLSESDVQAIRCTNWIQIFAPPAPFSFLPALPADVPCMLFCLFREELLLVEQP